MLFRSSEKRSQVDALRKLQPTNPYLQYAESRAVAAEAAAAGTAAAGIGAKLLGIGKLVAKWTGILTIILAAFDFIAGAMSKIPGIEIKSGLGLIMKVFTWIGNFFESLSQTIYTLGRMAFTLPGKGWWEKIKKESTELGNKYNATWGTNLEQESPETKALKSKETMDKIVSDFEKSMEEISKWQERQGQNAVAAFEKAAEEIQQNLQDRIDIGKITKKVEEDRTSLEKDLSDINKDAGKKIKDAKDNLEKERLSYSGQFVGGTELNKFQQRFQNDWSTKLIETNETIAEINKATDEKVGLTNKALDILNAKFDKFFKYVNEGLNPADLAEGLGL